MTMRRIYDHPMTPAERQARRRKLQTEIIAGLTSERDKLQAALDLAARTIEQYRNQFGPLPRAKK